MINPSIQFNKQENRLAAKAMQASELGAVATSNNKQQQAMTTLPGAMGTNKAIIYCDGCNQCHHPDAQRCSQDEAL